MVPRTTRAPFASPPSSISSKSACFAVGVLCALLGASLLAGCPQNAHSSAPADALTEPEAVLALVAEQTASRQSLIAEARVSYYGKEGARKAKSVILARRPAALHFSVYSPTDDLIAVLASDGETFTSFERGRDRCHAGRSCAENLALFSFFPLEGAQLVDVLMGGIPLIWSRKSEVVWDARASAYRVDLLGSRKVTQRIWVTHGTGIVKRMEVLRKGELEISVSFEDFEEVAGERLAHTLEMKMPGREIDLRVRYRDVELNTDIEDDAFVIPCPQGTQIDTLLCYDELPDKHRTRSPVKWAPTPDDSNGK